MNSQKMKNIYCILKNIDEDLRDIYTKAEEDYDSSSANWQAGEAGKKEARSLFQLDNAIGGMAILLDDLGRITRRKKSK